MLFLPHSPPQTNPRARRFARLRSIPSPPSDGFRSLAFSGIRPGSRISRQRALELQASLRAKWTKIMGPMPERTPLRVEEIERVELPGHTRLHIRYQVTPDEPAEAFLLLPKGVRGRRPGMVVLHQTSATSMLDPVGLAGRERVHIALHLVRRGYVCIAPRNFLWSEPGTAYNDVTKKVLSRWPTGMARMTWDAIRATDLLAARPEVDATRLGSIGHSLGAKEVIYHAAFDPRVRAAVSCEGGVGLGFSNWEAPWYLGEQIKKPAFEGDNHEVLALTAPRAFLLIGGESADGARSWPYIAVNQPVWRAWGAEEKLGLLLHPDGHNFPGPGADRDETYGWLAAWLGGDKE